MKILALQVLKTQVLIRGLLLYLIWLRFEETGKIMEEPNRGRISFEETGKIVEEPNRGRISSVGRAFDCRTGGRGFESRGRTITQGLKMTEK